MPKSYAKRHRLKSRSHHGNIVGNDDNNRKRTYRSDSEDHSRKKPKSATMSSLGLAFETPHPSLEAQKQAYHLPSSQPRQPVTPFSPIPVLPKSADKPDRTAQSHARSSRGLKENVSASLGRSKHRSSKTVDSINAPGLDQESQNRIYAGRRSRRQSRSASRSSNSSSSRASSRGPPSSNSKPKSNSQTKTKPKGRARKLNINQYLVPTKCSSMQPRIFPSASDLALLASPFASRASSPIKAGPHIATRKSDMGPPMLPITASEHQRQNLSKSQTLADIHFNPNVPTRSRSQRLHSHPQHKRPISHSTSAYNSPERQSKLGSRTSHHRRRTTLENEEIGTDSSAGFAWKDRRPSAPSDLQRPKPMRMGVTAEFVSSRNAKAVLKQEDQGHEVQVKRATGATATKHHLASGLEIQLLNDHPMQPVERSVAPVEAPLFSDDPFAWMHSRSGVDFNRPPSAVGFACPDVEGEDVFMSSEESGDDEETYPGLGTGFILCSGLSMKDDFGEDVLGASTPFKKHQIKELARTQSLPTLADTINGVGGRHRQVKAWSSSISISLNDHVKAGNDGRKVKTGMDSHEDDMDLTDPLQVGEEQNRRGEVEEENDEGDTPWITDSIISPPTPYKKMKARLDQEQANEEDEEGNELEVSSDLVLSSGSQLDRRLSSPFRLSCAESSSSIDEDVALKIHVANTADPDQKVIRKATTTQRTRSGTIVSAQSAVSSVIGGTGVLIGDTARRSRSGTIVGPSFGIGRSRSGTILAKPFSQAGIAADGSDTWMEGSARRTRSGTIVGPVPCKTAAMDGKSRSGSGLHFGLDTILPYLQAERPDTQRVQHGDNIDIVDRNNDGGLDAQFLIAEADDWAEIECHMDSHYLPRLTSSPDPIDFLRFTIVEDENAEVDFMGGYNLNGVGDTDELNLEVAKELVWRVADGPPSPVVIKKKDNQAGAGNKGRLTGRGRCTGMGKKGKGKKIARFVGIDTGADLGEEGQEETMAEYLSDDELLLVAASTSAVGV